MFVVHLFGADQKTILDIEMSDRQAGNATKPCQEAMTAVFKITQIMNIDRKWSHIRFLC